LYTLHQIPRGRSLRKVSGNVSWFPNINQLPQRGGLAMTI
jgi:hypothetical protein